MPSAFVSHVDSEELVALASPWAPFPPRKLLPRSGLGPLTAAVSASQKPASRKPDLSPGYCRGCHYHPPPKALTEPREPTACQRGICPAVWPQSTLTTTSFPPRPGCSHPPYSERKPIVTCSLVGSEREQTPSLQETKANQGHRAAGYHPPQMWACRADGGEPARE